MLGDSGEDEIQETGSTIMLMQSPLNVLFVLEDNKFHPIPRPQDDVEVTKTISTPRDLNEFPLESWELSYDTIDTVDAPRVSQSTDHKDTVGTCPSQSTDLEDTIGTHQSQRADSEDTLGTCPSLSVDHVDTVGALPSQSVNRKDTMGTTPGVQTMKTMCMSPSARTLTIKTSR